MKISSIFQNLYFLIFFFFVVASKKTVFDRLGGSGGSTSPGADPLTAAVSSTTSDPTFTVTGLETTKKAKVN